MSAVELRRGDIFDGPSDVIVLPCSTAGTITTVVRDRLVDYKIPFPRPGLRLGDVQVLPFKGGENIAQFVAYAASVDGYASSRDAIWQIGRRLSD